jgi:hypothetical protein
VRISPRAIQDMGGNAGIEQDTAGGGVPQRPDEGVAADLLENVPAGARDDRGEDSLIILVRGGRQDAQGRVGGADPPADQDGIAVRQTHISDKKINTARGSQRPVREIPGTDQDDIRLDGDAFSDATADNRVAFGDVHTDHGPRTCPVAHQLAG